MKYHKTVTIIQGENAGRRMEKKMKKNRTRNKIQSQKRKANR